MVVVLYSFLNKIGSFEIFAAILRASSFVSNFAADLHPGKIDVSELLSVSIAYDVVVRLQLGGPGRGEATIGGHGASRSAFFEPTVQVLFMQLPTLLPRYLSKTKEEHIANLRENFCDIRRYRRNRSRQRSSSRSLVRLSSSVPSSLWLPSPALLRLLPVPPSSLSPSLPAPLVLARNFFSVASL